MMVPAVMLRQNGEIKDLVKIEDARDRSSISAIKVNWAYSDDRLGKEFRRWASHHREMMGFPADERRNPTTDREYLKKLGAFRLLSVMSPEEAVSYTHKFLVDVSTGTKYSLYTSPQAFRRAAAEARELLFAPRPSVNPAVTEIARRIEIYQMPTAQQQRAWRYLENSTTQELVRLRRMQLRELLDHFA